MSGRGDLAETAVVVGGGSDLAVALLHRLAGRRLRRVLLAGRDVGDLESAAEGLRLLGLEEAQHLVLDVRDPAAVDALPAEAERRLGRVDLVVVAAGVLGTADLEVLDAAGVAGLVAANFSGPAAAALCFAKALARQGGGFIVVYSSVAGVRVRKANFVYGSAKAGLDGFLQGLSDKLAGSGVEVTIVRPGFVQTKMTAGLPAQPLAVDADKVAQALVSGLERHARVIWVPRLLGPLSLVIRAIPRPVWRRVRR